MVRELETHFVFTENERYSIVDRLLEIPVNPYRMYVTFKAQVRKIISDLPELGRFYEFLEYQRSRSAYEEPFVFVENCPIDPILPELDNSDPVQEKYAKKKTFVSEAFLQLYAELSSQHPIAYANVNDGDVFQDIFPIEFLKDSQSQKALGPIYFHKDFPNHFVRPDFVNILSLRSYNENSVYTIFVSNKDIFANLSVGAKELLREPLFYTPYDDISLNNSKVPLGRAPDHAVLSGINHLRFFENKTIGLNAEAEAAVDELQTIIHQCKKSVLMKAGDFVSIANNLSLHGREVVNVTDVAAQYQRWSLKTVNVHCSAPHLKHFVAGTDYLVNG